MSVSMGFIFWLLIEGAAASSPCYEVFALAQEAAPLEISSVGPKESDLGTTKTWVVRFVEEVTGPSGHRFQVFKKPEGMYWHSTATPFGMRMAVHGDLRWMIWALGSREAAEVFGYSLLEPQGLGSQVFGTVGYVIGPTSEVLNHGIVSTNRYLPDGEKIPRLFYAERKKTTPVAAYVAENGKGNLSLVEGNTYAAHDLAFHVGDIFHVPEVIQLVQRQSHLITEWSEFLQRREIPRGYRDLLERAIQLQGVRIDIGSANVMLFVNEVDQSRWAYNATRVLAEYTKNGASPVAVIPFFRSDRSLRALWARFLEGYRDAYPKYASEIETGIDLVDPRYGDYQTTLWKRREQIRAAALKAYSERLVIPQYTPPQGLSVLLRRLNFLR